MLHRIVYTVYMRFAYTGMLALFAVALLPGAASADHFQACTMQYDPVCGVSIEGQEQTYGNSCVLESSHARFLHDGECATSGGGGSSGSPGQSEPGYPGSVDPYPGPEPRPMPPVMIDPPEPGQTEPGYTGGSGVIPPDSCLIWFDGCNTCRKGSDGFWACTEMACSEIQKPYCREYDGDPVPFPPDYDPDRPVSSGTVSNKPFVPGPGCNAWYDGCNRCGRDEDGSVVCTQMACEAYRAGYCTDGSVTGKSISPSGFGFGVAEDASSRDRTLLQPVSFPMPMMQVQGETTMENGVPSFSPLNLRAERATERESAPMFSIQNLFTNLFGRLLNWFR